MADKDQGKGGPEDFGKTTRPSNPPGIGSDEDVEGHKRNYNLPGVDASPEGARSGGRLPSADGSDEDVEGHKRNYNLPGVDASPEGVRSGGRLPTYDGSEDDVEGHLYTGGPSTQGEFAKRGPGENPHGER